MESYDDFLTWVILGAIVLSVVAIYGWLFWSKSRAFWQTMIRLRDKIDRSKRW